MTLEELIISQACHYLLLFSIMPIRCESLNPRLLHWEWFCSWSFGMRNDCALLWCREQEVTGIQETHVILDIKTISYMVKREPYVCYKLTSLSFAQKWLTIMLLKMINDFTVCTFEVPEIPIMSKIVLNHTSVSCFKFPNLSSRQILFRLWVLSLCGVDKQTCTFQIFDWHRK